MRELELVESWFHERDTDRRVSNTLVGNGKAKSGVQVLACCSALWAPPHKGSYAGLCNTVYGCTVSCRFLSYSEILLCLVVCTSPSQTFLDWILMLTTWLEGLCFIFPMSQFYSFSWYLVSPYPYFIHISIIMCVWAPFNMHRQVWSACRCLRQCLQWSFLSSHSGYFCRSCGMSLVLVNALTGMSYISCVNVTFAVLLNRPFLLMKSDSSCL